MALFTIFHQTKVHDMHILYILQFYNFYIVNRHKYLLTRSIITTFDHAWHCIRSDKNENIAD